MNPLCFIYKSPTEFQLLLPMIAFFYYLVLLKIEEYRGISRKIDEYTQSLNERRPVSVKRTLGESKKL